MNCTENINLIRVALPFKCLIEFIERELFLKNCFRGCSGRRKSCDGHVQNVLDLDNKSVASTPCYWWCSFTTQSKLLGIATFHRTSPTRVLSKKWGMLKVNNCIDFSVHPCIALSSDTLCIGKILYIPLYWESYTWSKKSLREKEA